MTDVVDTPAKKASRLRSPEVVLYALFSVSVACALFLMALPRAIAPAEMPALTLSAAEVAKVMADDARQATQAPKTPAALELNQRFLEFGATEISALEDPRLGVQRRRLLHHLYQRVASESGEAAAIALRSQALSKLEAALDSRLPEAQVRGALGVFPNVLTEHMATRDGEELAPHFVMRTLYKARWNVLLDMLPDFRLAHIERLAYFGWLGLHAENLSMATRREALLKYAAAGGPQAQEALGVLAFLDRDFAHCRAALQRAYAADRSLRLRNYLRGVGVAATLSGAIGGVDTAPTNRVASGPNVPAR